MPNLYNLTGDLGDLLGSTSVISTAKAWLETNLNGAEGLIDTGDGGQVRLGGTTVPLDADGSFDVVGLVGSDSTDLNVEAGTLQYQLVVSYRDQRPGGDLRQSTTPRTYRSGWFYLNQNEDIRTVAKAATPAVVATGAEIIAAASAEADRAEAAAESATAPTDTQVATLAQDPESETSAALSATIAAGQSGLGFAPATNPVTAPAGTTPEVLDTLDGYVYGAYDNRLFRAASVDGPWTEVEDFDTVTSGGTDSFVGLHPLGGGEVLLVKATGLFRSTGWAANPLTATFTRALASNGVTVFTPFNVHTHPESGRVIATSYAAGAGVPDSRYVWLSTDNGATFNVVWDLGVAHPTHVADGHMHLAHFDKYDAADGTPRAFISYHNTVTPSSLRRVIYSDDDFATWNVVAATDTLHMPTVCHAHPSGLLLGSDEDPDSIYRLDRDTHALTRIFTLPRTGSTGWAAKAVEDETGAVHFLWKSFSDGRAGGVFTVDGYRGAETLTLPKSTAANTLDPLGLVIHDGRMVARWAEVDGTGAHVKITADAPRRGTSDTIGGLGLLGGTSTGPGVAIGPAASADALGYAGGAGAVALASGTALGFGANAGPTSTVIGREASAAAAAGSAIAIGYLAKADFIGAIVIGNQSTVTGTAAMVFGGGGATAHTNAVAIGYEAKATVTGSTAIGKNANASNGSAVAIGINSIADNWQSVALGNDTNTTADSQIQIGPRHFELMELASDAPVPPDSTRARLYVKDNGAGKTQLCVRFGTGTPLVIATQA